LSPPILVTGGAGYIGGQTVFTLLDAGMDVVVIDDLSTGRQEQLPSNVAFVRGNAGDVTLVQDVISSHGIKTVMHFAGSIVVPESVTNPLSYYENNTSVSRALIEACVDSAVDHFIFSSTASVYGNYSAGVVPESAACDPQSPYGRSKLMTEWILRDTAKATPLRYAILRYFNVAGADPKGRTGQHARNATHLIKIACEVATNQRQQMEIFGDDYNTPDGSCVRDFIHVADLAAAHVEALELLQSSDESYTFNCGYGRGVSVKEVIREFENIIGAPLNAKIGPRRAGDIGQLVSDPSQLKERTGWTPKFHSISDIILSALDWERRIIEQS